MNLMTDQEFKKLSQYTNEVCVSIFIPTHRGGQEVLEGKNQLNLKSQWQEIKLKLEKDGVEKGKIEKIEEPVSKLINDSNFWREQSDGLAVFASENFSRHYTLPINFEEHHYISKEFYLKPLTPLFTGNGRFYLLELQIFNVALYEATRYSIGKVDVEDLTPDRLEDRVGYDYEEKNRKHKTQHNLGGSSTQHGYEPATRERKDEFERFFRAVDKGLDTILHDENVPLVVACQDYLFPIYKDANTYKNLYEKPVPGNPSDYRNMFELHSKAIETLEPLFEKTKDEKIKEFKEQPPERTATRISDIIPAVFEGKVDTLFLQNREDIFGTYNEKNMKVNVQDHQTASNISLMNLAAKKVIEQNGTVYLLEGHFMPDKKSKMNALFRYTW